MGIDYISRAIEGVILEAFKYFSVISVTGPRQSGKSTLIKHLFPQYEKYSDFENEAGDIKTEKSQ